MNENITNNVQDGTGGSVRNIWISFIRVIACVLVFGVHINRRLNIQGPIGALLDWGATGPALFYIVSGYFAFQSRELKAGKVLAYYRKRAIRIIPTYLVTTFLYFGFYISVVSKMTAKQIFIYWGKTLFFGHIFTDAGAEWGVGAIWTVSFFVGFYIIVPWLYQWVINLKMAIAGWLMVLIVSNIWKRFFENYLPSGFIHALFFFFAGIIVYYAIKEHYEWFMVMWITIIVLILYVVGHANRFFNAGIYMLLLLAAIQMKEFKMCGGIQCIVHFLDRCSYQIFIIHAFVLMVMDLMLDYNFGTPYILSAVIITVLLSTFQVKIENYIFRNRRGRDHKYGI